MTKDDKPHISATQVQMYCRCGEQYRRRYIEKDIVPPGIAMLVGSGFHGGVEANFRQKMESHVDLPETEIVDAAVANFDGRLQGDGCILTSDESGRGQKLVIGEARDMVANLASWHAKEQAPDYQPAMVEEKARIVLPRSSHYLLGIIDLADLEDRITDFKTSKRKFQQKDVDTSVQLSIYAAAFQVVTQRRPAEVRLDTLIKTKTPQRQVLTSHRDQNDLLALSHRLNAVLAGIGAGVFPPCNPGDWVCSPQWCGYWNSCPHVNPERCAQAAATTKP